MPFPVMQWAQVAHNYHRSTILLGNGASIAVSPSFSYGSLLDYAQQRGLLATGDYKGMVDGVAGKQTRIAIETYQRRQGLAVDSTTDIDRYTAISDNPTPSVGQHSSQARLNC